MGRSLCLNGGALPVLMICVISDVLPKSFPEAAKASKFFYTIFTTCRLIASEVGRSATLSSFNTFSVFRLIRWAVLLFLLYLQVSCWSGEGSGELSVLPGCSGKKSGEPSFLRCCLGKAMFSHRQRSFRLAA